MSSEIEGIIKTLDISLEDLKPEDKVEKIKRVIKEMPDKLENPEFRKKLSQLILKHFKDNANIGAINIIIELIKKTENKEEKDSHINILKDITLNSPILQDKTAREKITNTIREVFEKKGQKSIIDIIIALVKQSEDISEISMHSDTLTTIIKGSNNEKDLIDYVETKKKEMAQWKYSVLIKGIIKKKEKLQIETAKSFIETITEKVSIKLNICAVLEEIYKELGDPYYKESDYYKYRAYNEGEFEDIMRKILGIVEKHIMDAFSYNELVKKIESQLGIIIDISNDPYAFRSYLKKTSKLVSINLSNYQDINTLFQRDIIKTTKSWRDYYIYVIRTDKLGGCEVPVFSKPNKLSDPIYFSDIDSKLSDLLFIDSISGLNYPFYVFIGSLLTAKDDKVRRKIINFMLNSNLNEIINWGLWLVGNIYMGTLDDKFKKTLMKLELNDDLIPSLIYSLAMLGAGSNDFDLIKFVIEKGRGLKDSKLDVLGKAFSLLIKHPISDDLRDKIKDLLSDYAKDDPRYLLEVIYAMFKGSRDYDIARWIRSVMSFQVVNDENISKVISAIIL